MQQLQHKKKIYTDETLKISIWNTCENVWKTFENHCKHIQHPIKQLQTNIWNTWKHLKHMLTTCIYIQHLDLLLQHLDKTLCDIRLEQWNIWNIHLKHIYSHYNMCNIPIYFCNIDIQHLQHTFKTIETLETYAFGIASAWCLDRLIDAELNAGTELNVVEWRVVRRCGARQRHEPQQVQGQADEARPRREVWVRERAPSASGLLCVARAGAARARTGSIPWREWAGDMDEAAWASVWSVRTDGRSTRNVFDIRETY
jgi:hypothetical protein